MSRLFGTDGIRGKAGHFPLDPDTVRLIGRALVQRGHKRVLTGRDTRESGVWLTQALCDGIASGGGEAIEAGVMTTPGVAALVSETDSDAGVMVSASHNPFDDNGLKIFSASGHKLSDQEEAELEECLPESGRSRVVEGNPESHSEDLTWADDPLSRIYLKRLLALPAARRLGRLKIVIDCANGAAFRLAPELFGACAASVETLFDRPDGCNINLGCGALHPERLAQRVVETGANLGAAFDGDADRCILVDERGEVVDGDDILYVLARRLQAGGRLPSATVVTTVMANLGLEGALEESGISLVRTAVGDRYLLEAMHQQGLTLGGEQSGHIIVADHSWAGDGMQTALLVAAAVADSDQPLSRLRQGWTRFPQVLVNVEVSERRPLEEMGALQLEMEEARLELADSGRLLLRYSGTEPLLRIMLEGRDATQIETWAQRLATLVRQQIGVDRSRESTG